MDNKAGEKAPVLKYTKSFRISLSLLKTDEERFKWITTAQNDADNAFFARPSGETPQEIIEKIAEFAWEEQKNIAPGWSYLKHLKYEELPGVTRDYLKRQATQLYNEIFKEKK